MLGIGKGKMELQLEKMSYGQGETIKGTATLKLKKTVEAEGLKIRLIANERRTQFTGNGTSTTWVKVYDFAVPLDGKKEYTTQPMTYNFELKVPQTTAGKAPEGVLGGVAQVASFLSGRRSIIKWYIEAKLDIPKGFDVRKKIQINIG